MNKHKLHWLFNRFMAEEDGSGTSGAAPAADTGAEASDDSAVDWGSMSDTDSLGEDGSSDEAGVVPNESPDNPPAGIEEGATTPPTETPPDQPTTGNETVQDPAAPVQDPEPQQTPEQQAEAQKKLEEDFAKWEQGQIAALTEQYGFDEDTASRLQTEPELVLPELAARMHMSVMKQVVETVQRMMPQMVQPVLQRTDIEAKATALFYGVNSDLNPKTHGKAVLQAAQLYRQGNPKASPEEAAAAIGEIVRTTYGLKTKPAPAGAAGKSKPAPHRPPAAGSRGAAPAKGPKEPTVWDGLIDD